MRLTTDKSCVGAKKKISFNKDISKNSGNRRAVFMTARKIKFYIIYISNTFMQSTKLQNMVSRATPLHSRSYATNL